MRIASSTEVALGSLFTGIGLCGGSIMLGMAIVFSSIDPFPSPQPALFSAAGVGGGLLCLGIVLLVHGCRRASKHGASRGATAFAATVPLAMSLLTGAVTFGLNQVMTIAMESSNPDWPIHDNQALACVAAFLGLCGIGALVVGMIND